jgi:signal peptidase
LSKGLSNVYLDSLVELLDERGSRLHGAAKDIAIVSIGVIIIWAILHFIFPTGNPFYIVSSGSMIPALNVNDILVVGDGSAFNDLRVGDIIVFHRPAGEDKIIVHRVSEIQTDSRGERVIMTKGDANPESIPGTDFPIRLKNYIGKVKFVIPSIGMIPKILSPPVNYILIGIVITVLLVTLIKRGTDHTHNGSGKNFLKK